VKLALPNGVMFNFRAAGILLHEGRVLLHRNVRGGWALPGGHIEPLEAGAVTLAREMREELGIEVTVERLVWVSEHFFHTSAGRPVHELCLYYLMRLPGDHWLYAREGLFAGREGERLHFAWQPVATLDSLSLYPEFLRVRLRAIPQGVEHIVTPVPQAAGSGQSG
jgi:8-oxo-dGTP pyrophosphatase MutT (NUDIX family)